MNVSEAKDLFRQFVKGYFEGYMVVYSHQSRSPKPQIPLVTILLGNIKRHVFQNQQYEGSEPQGAYSCKLPITLDLFTNGEPVTDDDTGEHIANEDTALDEMLLFANFLNSDEATLWCHAHDVSVVIEGDALNLTGLVNDTTYEFRSRLVVNFYFTQNTVGGRAEKPINADNQFS